MTIISDLSWDLVEKILSWVPMTSSRLVRSTCKRWNSLFKDPSFTKKHCGKATKDNTLAIMRYDRCVFLVRLNLNEIHIHKDGLVDISLKRIGKLNQVQIFKVIQCQGLLLCFINTRVFVWKIVVWNPYSGQTRLIEPGYNNCYSFEDIYAIGYDNNNNHKILRVCDQDEYNVWQRTAEIYDFKSDSWKVLRVEHDWHIRHYQLGVSLKGDTYFVAEKKVEKDEEEMPDFILCFDFTRERFEQRLPLPFRSFKGLDVVLSCVREEQLAALFRNRATHEMEIWVTTKIAPNAASWNRFLAFDMKTITGFEFGIHARSFLVDKDKVFICARETKNVNGEAVDFGEYGKFPYTIFYYVPSLVQINQGIVLSGKRKKREY